MIRGLGNVLEDLQCNIYTAALAERNAHPDYSTTWRRHDEHGGADPSCGDEMVLKLRIEDGVIEEAAFTGHGCAVSQASADMMADLVTGLRRRAVCGLFRRWSRARRFPTRRRKTSTRRPLPKASATCARVKCAELGWRTLSEIIGE